MSNTKRRSFYNLDTERGTKRKTMTITEHTWNKVTEYGKKGQTYDRIIYEAILSARLLDKIRADNNLLSHKLIVCDHCEMQFYYPTEKVEDRIKRACSVCKVEDSLTAAEAEVIN